MFDFKLFLFNLFCFQLAYLDIEYQKIEQTGGDREKYLDATQAKVARVPGTKLRALYGQIVVHEPFDNSYTIKFNFYAKQGGEYRLTPFNIPQKKFCESLQNEPNFFPEFADAAKIPLPLSCPFPNVKHFKCKRSLNCFYIPRILIPLTDIEWKFLRDL